MICHGNNHVWYYGSASSNAPIPSGATCQCGQLVATYPNGIFHAVLVRRP